MILHVGKTYKRRDGKITAPLDYCGNTGDIVDPESGFSYGSFGTDACLFVDYISGDESPEDIVGEA